MDDKSLKTPAIRDCISEKINETKLTEKPTFARVETIFFLHCKEHLN